MTAAGWYHAEGDPPGTTRYWDGERWVGDPQYSGTPSGGVVPATRQFPGKLKTLAIIVSVLKSLMWVLGLIGLIWLAAIADDLSDFDDEFGLEFDDVAGAVIGTFAVILLIGAILLFFQWKGALKEDPKTLFVIATIMAIVDGLLLLSSLNGGDPVGIVIILGVFVAQVLIAIWAKQADG